MLLGTVSTEPQLVATLDTTAGGPFTRLLIGDVDGDGRADFVTMQPDVITDNKLPHAVVALTAFDLLGRQLWQVGTVDPKGKASASDIPAQIYDLDDDGNSEVVVVMNDALLTLDGKTGKEKKRYALPDADAHDAISFADLRGTGRPSDIILKNRFDQLWAYDSDFTLLFTFAGDVGFYPWVFDWDEDGRDEIMAGCHFVDDDGTELWSCSNDVDTVVDSIWSVDLDPAANNGTEIVLGGGNTLGYQADGTRLFTVDTVEAQNLAPGEFRADSPGLEVAGLDRVDRTAANGYDNLFLLSATGEQLWQETRAPGSGWSTIAGKLTHWDKSGRDYVVAYARADALPTIYDGDFNVIGTIPDKDALLMVADLCGDERNEMVAYTDQYVRVYASGACALDSHVTGVPRSQPKSLYNWTRYWGGDVP